MRGLAAKSCEGRIADAFNLTGRALGLRAELIHFLC